MSEARRERIERAIDGFNTENWPAVIEFVDPEVRSRVAEGLGNPGEHTGLEGFVAMMTDWAEAWSENTLELREIEFRDANMALVHVDQMAVGAGSGVRVDFDTTFLVEFDPETDRATRFEIHPSRESALEAA